MGWFLRPSQNKERKNIRCRPRLDRHFYSVRAARRGMGRRWEESVSHLLSERVWAAAAKRACGLFSPFSVTVGLGLAAPKRTGEVPRVAHWRPIGPCTGPPAHARQEGCSGTGSRTGLVHMAAPRRRGGWDSDSEANSWRAIFVDFYANQGRCVTLATLAEGRGGSTETTRDGCSLEGAWARQRLLRHLIPQHCLTAANRMDARAPTAPVPLPPRESSGTPLQLSAGCTLRLALLVAQTTRPGTQWEPKGAAGGPLFFFFGSTPSPPVSAFLRLTDWATNVPTVRASSERAMGTTVASLIHQPSATAGHPRGDVNRPPLETLITGGGTSFTCEPSVQNLVLSFSAASCISYCRIWKTDGRKERRTGTKTFRSFQDP